MSDRRPSCPFVVWAPSATSAAALIEILDQASRAPSGRPCQDEMGRPVSAGTAGEHGPITAIVDGNHIAGHGKMFDLDMPHESTRHIGDFTIERVLAKGGFGTVYQACDRAGQRVALKVSHRTIIELSAQGLSLQQNEVEALIRLSHPSLVRVMSYGFLPDDRIYLAMELLDGIGMDRYLRREGRLDVIEAIPFMRKLVDTLAHCHQHNVLHLDLKPNNIIITDVHEPELKVLDFGLAALVENQLSVESRSLAGTLQYMAPELLTQYDDAISPRCDLYAVGVIFYEMLTGRHPFNGSNVADIVEQKRTGRAVPVASVLPSINEGVSAVIDRLLESEPGKRPQTAAELGSILKRLYYEVLRGGASAAASVDAAVRIEPDHRAVPIIGRDAELRRMHECARAAMHSGSWAAILWGEPGVGKSRLVAEFIQSAQMAERALLGYGRCRQHGDLVSYSCWRECLGQLASKLASLPPKLGKAVRAAMVRSLTTESAELRGLVKELGQLVDDSSHDVSAVDIPVIKASARVGTERVGHAVAHLLSAICDRVPVAIVLEDIHWADEGTMDVLGHLLSAELPERLLVVLTSRPLKQLPTWPSLDAIQLRPLEPSRNTELLCALLRGANASLADQLAKAVPTLRGGNPLFNTQVIHHLLREGVLYLGADGQVVLDGARLRAYEPPRTVAAVLERTLHGLRPESLRLLGVAALLGRQFHLSDVQRVEPARAADVQAAIDEASELLLCRALHDDIYLFTHDAIRDQLEAAVPAARRPELHALIAECLRVRGAPPGTLAYHFEQSGNISDAAVAYLDAGLEAFALHNLAGAGRQLSRAFELFARLPADDWRDRQLVRTTYEFTRITCQAGDTQTPLSLLDQCVEFIDSTGDYAKVLLNSAYAAVEYAQGKFAEAMQHSAISLEVKDPALSPYQNVPANMVGRALCASGRFGPSIDVLYKGCDLLRDAEQHTELAHSAGLLSVSLAMAGDTRRADEQLAESRRIADMLGDPVRTAGVCLYESIIAECRFDWEQGILASARLLAYSEEYNLAGLYLYMGTLMAGRHHFHIGQLARAKHLLKNAINLAKLFKIHMCVSWAHAYLGDIHFVQARFDDAQRWYDSGLKVGSSGNGDAYGVPLSRMGAAHTIALTSRDGVHVCEMADEALALLADAGNTTGTLLVLSRYVDALEQLGDTARAASVAARRDQLREILKPNNNEFWPSVPEVKTYTVEADMIARDFWKDQMTLKAEGSHSLAFDNTSVPDSELLRNLSQIEDFVPPFALP